MIERINFIEKERLQITYLSILAVYGVATVLCLLIFGVLLLSGVQTKAHQKLLAADVARLKIEREKLVKQEEAIQVTSPILAVRTNLEKQPPWSQLVEAVGFSLPANVWLVSFKSFDKADSPSNKGALLNGSAKNPQGLSSFLSSLQETPYLEKVVLTSSKEEGGVFNFSAACDISVVPLR